MTCNDRDDVDCARMPKRLVGVGFLHWVWTWFQEQSCYEYQHDLHQTIVPFKLMILILLIYVFYVASQSQIEVEDGHFATVETHCWLGVGSRGICFGANVGRNHIYRSIEMGEDLREFHGWTELNWVELIWTRPNVGHGPGRLPELANFTAMCPSPVELRKMSDTIKKHHSSSLQSAEQYKPLCDISPFLFAVWDGTSTNGYRIIIEYRINKHWYTVYFIFLSHVG